MPVSERGSHKRDYRSPDRAPPRPHKPYAPRPRPRPRPPIPARVPTVRRVPGLALGGAVFRHLNPGLSLAPYIPNPWLQGPKPIMPPWFTLHGPCMLMQSNIEFYRWTLTAVTSASCISGQAQGGGPTGAPEENIGADAAWNLTIPAMGSGYQKRGYWGMYNLSGDIWRGQHRLSIEKAAYKAPYVYTPATPAIQTYPMRMPNLNPAPDPNNWPAPRRNVEPEPGYPPVGSPLFPRSPFVPPTLPQIGIYPGTGGSLITETATGPVGAAIVTSGKPPAPGKLGPVAKPGRRVKETKKQRGPARLGRMLFKILDELSEGCEVIDALFDALPNDAKKAAMKKQGYVWSPSAKKYVLPGDGSLKASDQTTEAFRPQGAGSRAFVDQFGQYGADGCEWKAAALYANADRLDVCGGIQNIFKNFLEDKLHGVTHKYRPKNTVNALADADKQFGKDVNELLDELVDLCPK